MDFGLRRRREGRRRRRRRRGEEEEKKKEEGEEEEDVPGTKLGRLAPIILKRLPHKARLAFLRLRLA